LTAPYLLETFTTGTPSVFQTAPPQPVSNAFIIWYPELVGGAEASQNGLGDFIPAKFVKRLAIAILNVNLLFEFQLFMRFFNLVNSKKTVFFW
jgi:hypothetical protein